MKKREQKWTSTFKKFLQHKAYGSHPLFGHSLLWEVKTGGEGKSIPLSAVSLKQRINLALKIFVHKFSDMSRFGTPFDGIYIPKPVGVVVLSWDDPKVRDYAFIYPIKTWNQLLKTHPRKSMTVEQAKQTAPVIVRIT